MSRPRVILVVLAVAATGLLLPVAASAHAYLVSTTPSASGTVDVAPKEVTLTFDEAVEPRFALISVTDKDGHLETSGALSRSPSNPDTLMVPLKHVPEGWYLVFWRAISVDGHPVRGFFTFAVGPNPGPAPQFAVPSTSETAATPQLVVTRWLTFLGVMCAIGLFVLRIGIARPVVRRVDGVALGPLNLAFGISALVALAVVPIYLLFATAQFALRSVFDIGTLVPLFSASAFGRGYLDLELCFALFVATASVALWVDRPDRPQRSVVELLSVLAAIVAAGAVLIVPGAAGHAAQTAPRGISLALDWVHLASGSVWIGGLVGLIVLWFTLPARRRVAALAVCVPRFSAVALVAVALLLGSGIWATVNHMPTLPALWQTSYGQAILVKSGLLAVAILVAAVNLFKTKPRLAAARTNPELGVPTARLLRNLVATEAAIVTSAVLVAAVLSSLPPPPKSLALESGALAKVGPGPVSHAVTTGGYVVKFVVAPNRAAAPNAFTISVTKGGEPVTGADVRLTFVMLDMEMGNQVFAFKETAPGIYTQNAAALVMAGHWGLSVSITPKGGTPFTALVVDHAGG